MRTYPWVAGQWIFAGFWNLADGFLADGFLFPSVCVCVLLVVWFFPLLLCPRYSSNLASSRSMLRAGVFLLLFHPAFGAMGPTTAEEVKRAATRGDFLLPADRVMRRQTRDHRRVLVNKFRRWLMAEHGVSLFGLLSQKPLDGEIVGYWLADYGRSMFKAGKSYGQYSETINGIAMMRPVLKKQLSAAWDIAFAWLVDEPHEHHPALPLSVLLALLTVSLGWGWPYVSAVLALAWAGIMRIGEVLQAKRCDLILPTDSAPGFGFALLRIEEPKTRGRHARHQAARVDQCDVVSLLSAVYGPMAPSEALWPYSAATLRKRFNQLLLAVGLPTEKKAGVAPFTLGSLRPGGATWLLHASESSELLRRRGRWLSTRVMEIYLQEVLVATFVKKLDPKVRDRIEQLALGFPALLSAAIDFLSFGIPCTTWHLLLRGEAGVEGHAGKRWCSLKPRAAKQRQTRHDVTHGLAEKGDLLD